MFKSLRELIFSLLVAIVLAIIIRSFFISIYKIPTSSMQPNLLAGDFIIAYQLPYGFHLPFISKKLAVWSKPKRGEVFVFRLPGDEKTKYIKRVMAVAGDEIAIIDDLLYINGQAAKYTEIDVNPGTTYTIEKWEEVAGMKHKVLFVQKEETSSFAKMRIPAGSVFVLGDNRDSSDDSRYWGPVSLNNIESKVFGIWFSVDVKSTERNILKKIRWQRIFNRH